MKFKKNSKKIIILCIALFLFIVFCFYQLLSKEKTVVNNYTKFQYDGLTINYNFLTPNKYSRPQIKLSKVTGIVVHYTANPGASAKNNRDYFENLKTSHLTYASSHFVIGIKGEIIQCLPLNEISYASNNRNYNTISIECCHKDLTGKFTSSTLNSLRKLVQGLINTYHLKVDSVIRHYDITGKLCPKYFVQHPDKWNAFKASLNDYHSNFLSFLFIVYKNYDKLM